MWEETTAQEPLTCTLHERTSQKAGEHHVAALPVNPNSPLLPATQKRLHEEYLPKFSVVGTETPLKIQLAPKWDVYEICPLCPLLWEKKDDKYLICSKLEA